LPAFAELPSNRGGLIGQALVGAVPFLRPDLAMESR